MRTLNSEPGRASGMKAADCSQSGISFRSRIAIVPGKSTVSSTKTLSEGTIRIPSSFPVRCGNARKPRSSASACFSPLEKVMHPPAKPTNP